MFAGLKQRKPFAALLISLFIQPFLSMLYLGKWHYALLYVPLFLVSLVIFSGVIVSQWFMGGIAVLFLLASIHCYRVAKHQLGTQVTVWYARWPTVVFVILLISLCYLSAMSIGLQRDFVVVESIVVAKEFIDDKDFEQAREKIDALALACQNQLNDKPIRNFCFYQMHSLRALLFFNQFESDPLIVKKVMAEYAKATEYAQKMRNKAVFLVELSYSKGLLQERFRFYQRALDFYLDAWKQLKKVRFKSNSVMKFDKQQFSVALTYKIADMYLQTGDRKAAGTFYKKSEQFAKASHRDELIALTRVKSGLYLSYVGEYEEAKQQLEFALKEYEKIGDREAIAEVHAGLAIIYAELKAYEPAIELSNRLITFYKANNDSIKLAMQYNNLAEVYLSQGNVKLAAALLPEALTICRKVPAHYCLASVLDTMGHLSFVEKKNEQAVVLYQEAVRVNQETDDKWQLASTYLHIAEVYALTKNSKACQFSQKARELELFLKQEELIQLQKIQKELGCGLG